MATRLTKESLQSELEYMRGLAHSRSVQLSELQDNELRIRLLLQVEQEANKMYKSGAELSRLLTEYLIAFMNAFMVGLRNTDMRQFVVQEGNSLYEEMRKRFPSDN